MVVDRLLEKEKRWCLSGLEHIFHFALEQRSKCLIQACVIIAQQQFCGVSSFGHQAQVKFLLESIRHIIRDNCQQEFIHIMQYLKLLHSICPDMGCEEEYIGSVLKIKQSYVLYTLLDNESAADVCHAMNDFFPKDDPLRPFHIHKGFAKKRFLSAVRRQIISFQKLVTKLLTEVEFRQDYFFDEWNEEFGPNFHEEMLSDIDKYLTRIEDHLMDGVTCDEIYKCWINSENLRNPAMLCFLKLLMEAKDGKVSEFDALSFLKWLFPSLDTILLTMPCEGSVEVPELLDETSFDVLLSQTFSLMKEVKPWESDNFHEALLKWSSVLKSRSKASVSPKSFYGSNRKVRKKYSPAVQSTQLKKESEGGSLRVPLGCLDSNAFFSSDKNRRKREHADTDSIVNRVTKRHCGSKAQLSNNGVWSFACSQKANQFAATPRSQAGTKGSALELTFSSPHCMKLLESGSKFFSGGRRRKPPPCTTPDFQTPILGESSWEAIDFSDNEDKQNGSGSLAVDDETMTSNLTWISTCKNPGTPASRFRKYKKTCRSLHFKSESSDDHVSESEPESSHWQPMLQDCITMLDQSLIPDLTYHLKATQTQACTVQLRRLCDMITDNFIAGCKISDEDLRTILQHDYQLIFHNYS